MSLAQDKSQYIDRNILSARDLGANRKIHIHIGREHRRSDEDYVQMFSRYGGITSIADRFQYVPFMMHVINEGLSVSQRGCFTRDTLDRVSKYTGRHASSHSSLPGCSLDKSLTRR